MPLTRVDRERIHDSRMKIESVAETLNEVAAGNIQDLGEIQDCLEDAKKSLKDALGQP